MSLREQGFKFYVSPDKQLNKWLIPAVQATDPTYAGWTDVTDWPDEQFARWLMETTNDH